MHAYQYEFSYHLKRIGSNVILIKIVHIITGLTTGGAEMMLYKLLSSMDRKRFDCVVVSMMDKGEVGSRIEALGIPVYALRMKGGRPTISAMIRLIRLLRTLKPNLLQGWMYHANLLALIAKIFVTRHPPVLWNIRQSLYRLQDEKRLTQLVIRIGRVLSPKACRIIYNSRISALQHEALGYCKDTRILLSNGFDIKRFSPAIDEPYLLRQELGLDENTIIVGVFARYHPMKDHKSFIQAANIIFSQNSKIHFILVGRNVCSSNSVIHELVSTADAKDNLHLLGERADIPELMKSIDIAVTSSAWGEGFPNALGEAMACAIPCVVTDVGDSAWILGSNHGEVVPPKDPQALAKGILKLINMDQQARQALGDSARQRVVDNFSLEKITVQYEDLYENVSAEYCSRC